MLRKISKNGFTLIETLIVLLIISILVSLIFLKFNFMSKVDCVELLAKSKIVHNVVLDDKLYNEDRKLSALTIENDYGGSENELIGFSSEKMSEINEFNISGFFENSKDSEYFLNKLIENKNLSLEGLYGLLRPLSENLSVGLKGNISLSDYLVVVNSKDLYDSSVSEYTNYDNSLEGTIISKKTIVDSEGTYCNGISEFSKLEINSIKSDSNVKSDVSENYNVKVLNDEVEKGVSSNISFEIKDENNKPLDSGEEIYIEFLDSDLSDKKGIISNGKVEFNVLFNDLGEIRYLLYIGNEIIYFSINPMKVIDVEDKQFTVDINKDITVDAKGKATFNNSNWVSYGSPTITNLGEFYPGSSGGYKHDLKDINATFELKVKSYGNNGSAGFNSMMLIRTGNYGLTASFYPDKVVIYDNPYTTPLLDYKLNGKEYHTYRLVKEDNKGTFYIDNKLVSNFTLRSGTGYGQYIFSFGDGTGMGGNLADTYFKDIRIAPGEVLYIEQ